MVSTFLVVPVSVLSVSGLPGTSLFTVCHHSGSNCKLRMGSVASFFITGDVCGEGSAYREIPKIYLILLPSHHT